MVVAACECGFQTSELFLGAGWADFQERCALPVLCQHCGIIFTRNLLAKTPIRCPECRKRAHFYTEPSLQGAVNDKEPIFSWNINDDFTVSLPDTDYLCPECKEIKMRFVEAGNWD